MRGSDVAVDDRSATPLALLFHELATNATKYGALSVPEGVVTVAWCVGRRASGEPSFSLRWREHGGPPAAPPARKEFGSRLIERGLPVQLGRGGAVAMDFAPEGLRCRITAPLRPGVAAAGRSLEPPATA